MLTVRLHCLCVVPCCFIVIMIYFIVSTSVVEADKTIATNGSRPWQCLFITHLEMTHFYQLDITPPAGAPTAVLSDTPSSAASISTNPPAAVMVKMFHPSYLNIHSPTCISTTSPKP